MRAEAGSIRIHHAYDGAMCAIAGGVIVCVLVLVRGIGVDDPCEHDPLLSVKACSLSSSKRCVALWRLICIVARDNGGDVGLHGTQHGACFMCS